MMDEANAEHEAPDERDGVAVIDGLAIMFDAREHGLCIRGFNRTVYEHITIEPLVHTHVSLN